MKGEIKFLGMIFLVFSIVAITVLLSGAEKANAAYNVNKTGNATITLTIAAKTMIDITPQTLNYTTQDPGTAVVNYTYNSQNLSQIQIENIGSTNLTNVWFNVSQPTERPFGTGDPTKYDAGNFLAIKNSSMSDYLFIDRLEYNHSTDIVYLTLPANYQRQGRLRIGPNEFFWATASSQSENACNGSAGSGDILHIATTAHTQDSTGDIDLSDGGQNILESGDSNWGLVQAFDIDGVDYCAAVSADCSKVRFYRWNADAPGADTCTLDERYSSSTLTPGDSFAVDLRLYVPYGTAQGEVTNGTLTVLATAV